ncbi:thiol-disulfide oxidoreductase DCC family protein [Granulosicoccus antarcticus]|nr:DUF393 domain-containing protein [Granulosicoccus antarcticus]
MRNTTLSAPLDYDTRCDLTVYYDGGCPLCRREIATYQSLSGAERLNWEDVAQADERVAPDLMRSDALARMHVRTADGKLVHGAHAFALMWQVLPKTRWLGRLAATRPALWVLEPAYRAFLKLRPLWRKQGSVVSD